MKQILLNAFDMNCVGHIQQGLWTHPRDRSTNYLTMDHWVRLARILERGLFDGLFLADVLGTYDVYAASPKAAIQSAVQATSTRDPTDRLSYLPDKPVSGLHLPHPSTPSCTSALSR